MKITPFRALGSVVSINVGSNHSCNDCMASWMEKSSAQEVSATRQPLNVEEVKLERCQDLPLAAATWT
jgi:hypothetical protein